MGPISHVLRVPLILAIVSTAVARIYKEYPSSPALLGSRASPSSDDNDIDTSIPSLYALADIHGDYTRALDVLIYAGVVDKNGNWIAGRATFVQTGDIVDRGPDTIKLYKWMRKLTDQAEAQGGKVVKLWGNHEFWNAKWDFRYVAPKDLRSFPAPHKETRRTAFSLKGSIGSDWMIDYRVTYIDPVMRAHFMHAGLTPEQALKFNENFGIDLMGWILSGNRDRTKWTQKELFFYEDMEGPMMYRGYATLDEETACVKASKVMKILKVDFLVMGHTTFSDGALVRCGGRVLLIDTGLSRFSHRSGRPVVLEMRKNKGGNIEVQLHYTRPVSKTEIIRVSPSI